MESGLFAFRFALLGFALTYCFVLNPALLLLSSDGNFHVVTSIIGAVTFKLLGIIPLAIAITGRSRVALGLPGRAELLLANELLMFAQTPRTYGWLHTLPLS